MRMKYSKIIHYDGNDRICSESLFKITGDFFCKRRFPGSGLCSNGVEFGCFQV